MTYNLGNGLAQPERLIHSLHSGGADLIALQELSEQQAEAIRGKLDQSYPHQALFPGGFEGKGIISRFPIRSVEQIELYPFRPDLIGVVDIGGLPLRVVVAHPPPPQVRIRGIQFDPLAKEQITALIQKAIASSPAVLVGDLNTTQRTATYAEFQRSGLKDAFRDAGAGTGHTLPVRIGPWRRLQRLNRMLRFMPLMPFIRVDYIWHTQDITAIAAWLGEDAGSDHLPVLARLAMAK